MASAVLRLSQEQTAHAGRLLSGVTDVQACKDIIVPMLTFERGTPPPQLPQIPVQLWAEVCDEVVDTMAMNLVEFMELHNSKVCMMMCLCPCGSCIFLALPVLLLSGAGGGVSIVVGFGCWLLFCATVLVLQVAWLLKAKKMQSNQDQRWECSLSRTKSKLASLQIGVSLAMDTFYTGGGNNQRAQQTIVGLKFEGAAVAPLRWAAQVLGAPAAPAQVAMTGQPNFCPTCGTQNSSTKFCCNCGMKFRDTE